MTIRPLEKGDREAIERISRQSPEAARWRPEDYEGLPGWVAEGETGVIGFVVARSAADEMEILNLAVEPAGRRRGAGRALLAAALDRGRAAGARRAWLEVRESNRVAQLFYESRGFAVAGRRPRYYSDPVEDALVMAFTLPEGA